MTTLQAGASTLYYELHDAAPGRERPTLVLLHGVGGNHASWFQQITVWRERYRVLVVDARGFGNSIDAEGAGRDRFVADLEAVLDAAQVGKAVFIGQSMGGGTALSLSCLRPDRVAALVLADTLFGVALPDGVRERMAALTERNAALTQVQRVLGPTCVRERPEMATLYTTLASFNRVNVKTLKGTQALHTPQALADTGLPVLFLVGEEDVLFPPDEVRAVQAHVAGADFIVLPASGHSAYFETPQAFDEAVLGWLARRGIALK
jgi:3-oxoadipate enol-lactonase